MFIFSNCVSPSTVNIFAIVKLSLGLILPAVWFIVPFTVNPALTVTAPSNVVVPSTVKLLLTVTSLFGTVTGPVPAASKCKSLFVSIVSILLPAILILPFDQLSLYT